MDQHSPRKTKEADGGPLNDSQSIVSDPPEYTHQYTMGENPDWGLPRNVVPIAENKTHVKIALIDETPSRTVHAEKEALRNGDWASASEFRADVEWPNTESKECAQ